uniref:Uncharacterized protein n=1 Tax=Heterorhabditis bacteriophora TaxID=37862 RepID=A0A1I7WQE7_HETBA
MNVRCVNEAGLNTMSWKCRERSNEMRVAWVITSRLKKQDVEESINLSHDPMISKQHMESGTQD